MTSVGILRTLAQILIGESLYDAAPVARVLQEHYMAPRNNTLRPANRMLAGLDFAIWDAQGKIAGRPVNDLPGGAFRRKVGYFYFLQGDTTEDPAAHAAVGAATCKRVFYLKVGRDEKTDLEIVRAVRAEIGDARLTLDANEGWESYQAIRMCRKLGPFDIDFIEQPTSSGSIDAMVHVRQKVSIPIVADQAAFTLYDVYQIYRRRAADMICIGPREVSGNQIMWQLAQDNIVTNPPLTPDQGWLDLPDAPGLGVTLDESLIDTLSA